MKNHMLIHEIWAGMPSKIFLRSTAGALGPMSRNTDPGETRMKRSIASNVSL